MTRLLEWLDHRTGYRDFIQEALYERVPGGARWRYVWGSTLVFTFVLQMITGVCLWAAYSPSAQTAWESVYFIQYEMTLGWLVRGLHHFAAQAMIVLLVIHLVQVVIDGAYRAPREINFWLGLVLMQIVMGLGLTGYLLPWDQKGYYATQVATEIMGSAPFVGPSIQQLMQGGNNYGHHTLTRFFALHAGVLPALLIGFLFLHLALFRRHGLTPKTPHAGPDQMFWPDQVLKDSIACLAVLGALLFLTVWKGAELSAPADPSEPYSAARPEWYYLFLFRFLKFGWVSQAGEATHLGEAFGAIVIPGAMMLILFLMPIIAYARWGHAFNVAYLWIVMAFAGGLTGLAIYEDWFQEDEDSIAFREAVDQAHHEAQRVIELAQSPTGIPPRGAGALLREDPLTQGPPLFAKYCIDCHQPEEGEFSMPPQAPALVDLEHPTEITCASREWIRKVLTDFGGQFASLKNITGDRAEAAEAILEGSMKDWSDSNGPILLEAENQKDFDALVEFLYAQSQRPDALAPDDPVVVRGQEIFETGELANGAIDACVDCHSMTPLTIVDGSLAYGEPLSEDLQPILTGYGSASWYAAFIADPQAHYAGEYGNNAMPGFADQLTPGEIGLLARWLAVDYYLPASHHDLAHAGAPEAEQEEAAEEVSTD